MSNFVLNARSISKAFLDGQHTTEVLHQLDLTLSKGESLAVTGASGSGKSTLLHVLGGLDRTDSGDVLVEGVNLMSLSEPKLAKVRGEKLGFVYQFHHLLPEFSAVENVAMPLLLQGTNPKVAADKARDMLQAVGLGHRLANKPGMLSGGERQRAAIARALVHEPKVLLADEPTGNLDAATAKSVFELLKQLQEHKGLSMILVTHDQSLAAQTDRCLHLENGRWA